LLGCFWGLELAFQRVPGVVKTEVGFTQGGKKNPTYDEVCTGTTGHVEAIQVTFDSTAIKYEDLLVVFWESIDPTAVNQQGNDVGTQYRTGIYYMNENQMYAAKRSKEMVQKRLGQITVTEILPSSTWYPAEQYHQQYLEKGGQCARTGDLTPIRCYG
jgi:peptide-methionine (S)-S-oxide reductase